MRNVDPVPSETAGALFRRVGFTKTTVADIASELSMSPANVYRFFASKNAIVEAICKSCLSEVEEKAWTVARSKASASVVPRAVTLRTRPPAVYRGEQTAEQFLAGTTDGIANEQWALEELLLLWLTNQNPAYEKVHDLVHDDDLVRTTAYAPIIADPMKPIVVSCEMREKSRSLRPS